MPEKKTSPRQKTTPRKKSRAAPTPDFRPDMEETVGVLATELAAIYAFERVKGFGPQKFKQLADDGINLSSVLMDPDSLPMKGKRGETFRDQLHQITPVVQSECLEIAKRQISTAHHLGAQILTYGEHYPRNVYDSNNPIPALYIRGGLSVVSHDRTVACVGSRGIRAPYDLLQREFARVAVSHGFAVVSGFALGADSVAHLAAREAAGRTICCMPGGLDRPFPPENRAVWDDFMTYPGAVFVSEFRFGTRASSLTLRKRNKLIVAFARGVLVGQSSVSGGAMNAYRFGKEQKKPLATFEADGSSDTSGNQLISDERKDNDVVFPKRADEERYFEWLRKLSSSI